MSYSKRCVTFLRLTVIMNLAMACFQGSIATADEASRADTSSAEYLLGPQDQLAIKVVDMEETPSTPLRIDPNGNVDLPLIGTVHAAGLTIGQLRAQLVEKYKKYIIAPVVTVAVVEFRSQPVTVVGSVHTPGVHQIEGPKRLLEVISLAGGLKDDAGAKVIITREASSGPLPLPNARNDVGGRFSVGEIELPGLIAGTTPSKNILIMPHDVVSVPAADLVYVLGEVTKPGGFTIHTHASISALEAVAMAGGAQKTAKREHSRILRVVGDGQVRATIPIDLAKIMDGKSPDVPLQADDILLIPNNVPRAAAIRAIEAIVTVGTGILIYHSIN